MQFLTLLQVDENALPAVSGWLLEEFGPSNDTDHELVINIAIDPPIALSLYGSQESNSEERFQVVLQSSFNDAEAQTRWLRESVEKAPVIISRQHTYAVESTVVIHRQGFLRGRSTPGYKLLRGLYLFDDLSDAAAQRMWAHHSDLATRVHIGMSRYCRHWVHSNLTPDAPKVRGFSDLHFPDVDSMVNRYFDSERGRQEIIHDIGHFIKGGTQRMFLREHVFPAT